jgi:integrase
MAHWQDGTGSEWSKEFTTRGRRSSTSSGTPTVGQIHDPRHSYATWLVSAGVPINDVSAVMGHVRTSTTLDRYTHPLLEDRDQRVRTVFADFC